MYVCYCSAATVRDVNEAIDAGATTVDDIGETTGAGAGCGGCHPTLEQLIEQRCKECPRLSIAVACRSDPITSSHARRRSSHRTPQRATDGRAHGNQPVLLAREDAGEQRLAEACPGHSIRVHRRDAPRRAD